MAMVPTDSCFQSSGGTALFDTKVATNSSAVRINNGEFSFYAAGIANFDYAQDIKHSCPVLNC
jgi:hypothetical protein